MKIKFNVENDIHIKRFTFFLKNKNWGPDGCPFELEDPFTSVPSMIYDKIARHYCDRYFDIV